MEASLKTWISNSLSAYSTIAETEAKLDSQKKEIESQLSAQKTYLEEMISNLESSSSEKIQANANLIKSLSNELDAVKKTQEANASEIASMKNELAKSKEDITRAYTAAISSAINTLDGKLSEKVNAEISKINERIDNEVTALEQKLSALDDRIGALEGNIESVKSELKAMQDEISALKDKISKIVNKVISISHVPTYEDGYEVVPYTMDGSTIVPGDFTLKFEVAPASAAEEIASVWQSALSAKVVYTLKTKAAGDFVPLTIKSATGKDGMLVVELSSDGLSEAFFKRTISSSVRIVVSNSSNLIISDYVPIKVLRGINDYVVDGFNFGPAVEINDLKWAPVNCGSTLTDLLGIIIGDQNAQKACPLGWRLPSKTELELLSQNYSELVNENELFGRWFSGDQKYSKDVPAVFLPAAGRGNNGRYGKNELGYYWSSDFSTTEYNDKEYWYLKFDSEEVEKMKRNPRNVTSIFSVRCVKD